LRISCTDTYDGIRRQSVSRLGDQIREQAATSRRKHGIDTALAQLSDEEERNDLLQAILDPAIPLHAIAEAMRKRGIRLSTHSIRRARRGELICEP
jgi:hypothetical protein